MAPTGIVLHDPREQLRAAAERILARDGAGALTSRQVTTEAGVAKGVLHRCFRDFDSFLVDLVEHRAARIRLDVALWTESSRPGTVAETVAETVRQALDPVVLELVALVLSRDEVSGRLRRSADAWTPLPPLLCEATQGLTTFLQSEQQHGRLAASADGGALALMVVAAAYVLLAGAPRDAHVTDAVDAVVRSALRTLGADVG